MQQSNLPKHYKLHHQLQNNQRLKYQVKNAQNRRNARPAVRHQDLKIPWFSSLQIKEMNSK